MVFSFSLFFLKQLLAGFVSSFVFTWVVSVDDWTWHGRGTYNDCLLYF